MPITNDWRRVSCRWKTRRSNTSAEKDETLRVLRWLTNAPSKALGALSQYTIAKEWPQNTLRGKELSTNRDQIGRWLGGENCPSDENLWYFAEALKAAGRPWCTNISLLWACGRIARCVQIIAFLLFDDKFEDGGIDRFWQFLCHLTRLYCELPIDDMLPSAKLEYLVSDVPSVKGILIAIQGQYELSATPNLLGLILVYEYVNRELDKAFCNVCGDFASSIASAARRAFNNDELIVPFAYVAAGEALDLAFRVGNASDLALDTKREVALEYLAKALNAFEGLKEVSDTRPVQHAIESDLFLQLKELSPLRRLEEEAFEGEDPEWVAEMFA